MGESSYVGAVIQAHHEVFEAFDEAFVMGEDIRSGTTGTTKGLVDEFGPERVRDVPISEQAFTGTAIGAAMDGKRPIVEYQINTLPLLVVEQLVNNAQKLRYMSGGQVSIPLTITVPTAGVPGGAAAQHSDNPYPVFMHYGVKTVVPSTPADAKGLFHTAVGEDDPVAVYWPITLLGNRSEVPDDQEPIPLGEATVRREGADVTVVAVGELVPQALSVAEELESEANVEVIDPRTLVPLDEATILESVRKTNRVVVADNTHRTCGVAAELSARIGSQESFWHLDAPIKRVTRADAPTAYNPPEEQYVQPNADTLETAIRDVLAF